MRLLHRFTLAKQQDEPHLNEDAAFALVRSGLYALSDGASESYDSRRWARTLVANYACSPRVTDIWIRNAIAAYDSEFERAALPWNKQAAYDRGSFATLLSARIRHDGVEITAVGDSLAVIEQNGEAVLTHPYTNSAQFEARPLLLSTLYDQNQSIDPARETLFWRCEQWDNVRIYLMTDAIGTWLLEDLGERLAILRKVTDAPSFVDLVESARGNGTMRRDDTTLIVIG